MRKAIGAFACLLVMAVGAEARSRDFYAGALAHPLAAQDTPPSPGSTVAPPPITGDLDMTNPIVAAFVLSGQYTQWVAAQIKALGETQFADEAKIAEIPAGAPGPAGPQGEKGDKGDKGDTGAAGTNGASLPAVAVPAGYTIQLTAINAGCSYGTQGADASGLTFSGTPAPFFCDFLIPVLQAGNYMITTHMRATSGVAPVLFHYEAPIGTSVGAQTFTPTNNSFQFVRSAAAALAQGFQIVRLVVDQPEPGTNTNQINWISLTKQ